MRIVVIGGTGVTGDGLEDAMKGASVVVGVTNSPSWEDAEVLKSFETSTRDLLAYEAGRCRPSPEEQGGIR